MIPSASDLTYFIEVSYTLNLSRASERLGISQPSLTLAIQRLESVLGTQILSRNKKGVTLTQAGKQFLIYARQLLHSWDQVKAQTIASVSEIQGTYTLGCHPSVGLYTLSNFLPKLLSAHPQLNIKLKHDLSRKITEDVISSRIDIGIVINPVQHPDLIIHKLSKDKVTFWSSGSELSMNNLTFQKAVLICDPELMQTQMLLKQLKNKGIATRRIVSSNSLELIADLTAHGCGIGILPECTIKTKALKEVPKAPVVYDELCLLYRMENKNVKSIQALSLGIKNSFKKMP